MSDTDTNSSRVAAPYIAYQTLRTFIEPLKEHVIPNRIDKSLLKSMSGAVQGQLMTALRFLALIDDESRPTEKLKKLVAAYDTENWSSELNAVLKAAYPEIFALNLGSASPSEFNEAFKKAYPCEGETLRKGVTFFLNAGREAGVGFSPFLTKNTKPRSGPTKRRTKQNGKRVNSNESSQAGAENDGKRHEPGAKDRSVANQLLAKFPEFDPSWPDPIKTKWFEGYERLLGMTTKAEK